MAWHSLGNIRRYYENNWASYKWNYMENAEILLSRRSCDKENS